MEYLDFFGRRLGIGDRVAFVCTGYRDLRHGEIIGFNEKRATIKDLDYDGPECFADRMGYGRTCREYSRIVKEI